jgi:hypothetical protein
MQNSLHFRTVDGERCLCQALASAQMSDPNDSKTLQLAAAHRLVIAPIDKGGDALRLIAPDGSIPLIVNITSQGVELQISSLGISLHTSGDLIISADHLRLEGRNGLALASGSDLDLTAAHDLNSRAQAQMIAAEQGGVDVRASDDVKLSGERVMVNCDETVDKIYRAPPR